jgi:hypothetical protein
MKASNALHARGFLLLALAGLAGPWTISTAAATEHETQCFNEVQGKIPWNADKNMNWDPENVKQLCRGTTKPSEPGKCFLHLSSDHVKGEVSWGRGTDWQWRNIINLCSGTNDADKTVACFNNGVKTGADWRDVILTCQRSL